MRRRVCDAAADRGREGRTAYGSGIVVVLMVTTTGPVDASCVRRGLAHVVQWVRRGLALAPRHRGRGGHVHAEKRRGRRTTSTSSGRRRALAIKCTAQSGTTTCTQHGAGSRTRAVCTVLASQRTQKPEQLRAWDRLRSIREWCRPCPALALMQVDH